MQYKVHHGCESLHAHDDQCDKGVHGHEEDLLQGGGDAEEKAATKLQSYARGFRTRQLIAYKIRKAYSLAGK
eukprot:3061218-Prorocentrum_lima.AAC.1